MKNEKQINPRKKPKQERSKQIFEDMIDAAIRVLEKYGAHNFTTIKVAETAGVSVGSLYQYFPNKESILAEIQIREMKQTMNVLSEILNEKNDSVENKLEKAIYYFIDSEFKEVILRKALKEVMSLIGENQEVITLRENIFKQLETEIIKLLNEQKKNNSKFETEFFITVLTQTAESVSDKVENSIELDKWKEKISKLLINQLKEN